MNSHLFKINHRFKCYPELLKYIVITGLFSYCLYYLAANAVDHSYDLVFSDQIDLFYGYLNNKDLTSLFHQQHGPHRQGAGAIIMNYMLKMANWDVRCISYLTIGIMVLSAICFTISLWKTISLITISAITVLLLSNGSVELITVTPNISHSAMPMFFCSILMLILFSHKNDRLRHFLAINLAVLNSLFTGFGIFIFLSYFLVFTIYFCFFNNRPWSIINYKSSFLIFCYFLFFAGVALFLYDYNFSQVAGKGCSASAFYNLKNVLTYSFAIASLPFGGASLGGFSIFTGFIVLTLYSVICIFAMKKLCHKGDGSNFIILVLVLSSGAFVLNAATGRHCLGIDTAYSSRYYQLSSLGLIGALIAIDYWWGKIFPVSIKLFSLSVIIITFLLVNPEKKAMSKAFHTHKANFVSCLQDGGTVTFCNNKFSVYPPDSQRLNYVLTMIKDAKSP